MLDCVIGFVENFELTELHGNSTLTVDCEKIKDISSIPRKDWNKNEYKTGLIWLAGGGSYLLENRYIVLVKRSLDAPSNPGRLTIATGLSDQPAEWENPSLMVRELFEEVVLLNKNQNIFYFPSAQVSDLLSAQSVIAQALVDSKFENIYGQIVQSEVVEELLTDRFVLKNKGIERVVSTLFHIAGNQINFLYVISLDLPVPIQDVIFYDTEFKIENGKKVFLNREIFLYDLQLNSVVTIAGEVVVKPEMTAHANFLIQKMTHVWRKRKGNEAW